MLPQAKLRAFNAHQNSLDGVLYPNGECVVYRPRRFNPSSPVRPHRYDSAGLFACYMRAYGSLAPAAAAGLLLLGLSPLPIFDTSPYEDDYASEMTPEARAPKGLKGMTSYGARMVRNAAYLLERDGHRWRCIFATVTVPDLPVDELGLIHEGWHDVVERYRLGLRRTLRSAGLSGDSVTVSEIQEKRHERTGLPVLHLHTLFVGVDAAGKFALTTEAHDQIWLNALRTKVPLLMGEVRSACNLQRVHTSAAGYLGKYMTKGAKAVEAVKASGLESWLPKHWWNATRSLVSKVKAEVRSIGQFADWLYDVAESDGQKVWDWFRDVQIELRSGQSVTMARYGRLSISQTAQIIEFCNSEPRVFRSVVL